MYFSHDEYERRWSVVGAAIVERDLTAALVWGRGAGTHDRCANVTYLTNYYSVQPGNDEDSIWWEGVGHSAVILRPGHGPVVVTDMPDAQDVAADQILHADYLTEGVIGAFRQLGVSGRVGLVGYSLIPGKYLDALRAELPELELVPSDDLIDDARRRKSAVELDCLREGGEIFTEAMTKMLEVAVGGAGLSQAEVASVAHASAMKRGATVFTPIGSGRAPYRWSEDVRTGASPNVRLEDGDMFRTWVYGPAREGYWLDPGRSLVVGGKPTARQKWALETANQIVHSLTDAVMPGVKVAELAELGNRLRAESGSGEDQASTAWPVFGHGIGLFWDTPIIVSAAVDSTDVIREGDALGLEVFLYWPDVGSVAMENNVIVGAGGCEVITPVPEIWW